MSLSDCPRCWDSPCTCGYDYWFMDVGRLEEIAAASAEALRARRAAEPPPPAVAEEMDRRNAQRIAASKMTSEDWGRSFTISAKELRLKPGFGYEIIIPKTKPPG